MNTEIEFEHCKLENDNNTLEEWTRIMGLPDDMREAVLNAKCVLVPQNYDRAQHVFMPTAGVLFQLLRNQMGADVEICVKDEDFDELNLYSEKIRLGHIFVHEVAIPLFVTILGAFIYDQMKAEREVNSIVPVVVDQPQYMNEPKVEIRLTIPDSKTGKNKEFYYDGDADKVIDAIKALNVSWDDTKSKPDTSEVKK